MRGCIKCLFKNPVCRMLVIAAQRPGSATILREKIKSNACKINIQNNSREAYRLALSLLITMFKRTENTIKQGVRLDSVLSHCARGKSSIARRQEVYPKIFNGKKRFKNVTLEILNFILVSEIIKEKTYGAMLIFVYFHCMKQYKKHKSKENLTLHHRVKVFIS